MDHEIQIIDQHIVYKVSLSGTNLSSQVSKINSLQDMKLIKVNDNDIRQNQWTMKNRSLTNI